MSTSKSKQNCKDLSYWVRFMIETRQDNDMTNRASAVYDENKTNYHDQSDWVSIVTKTRQDNYINNRINVIYAKNEAKPP